MGISVSGQHVGENETSPHAPSGGARLRYLSLAIILLLWCAIYFAGMFTPPLLDDVDTIHAEAAREMVLRHDWVTLHVNGIRYLSLIHI